MSQPELMRELQQSAGNQALLRLLSAGALQTKSKASSGLLVQRKCAACAVGAPCSECGDEERERVQHKRSGLGSRVMIQRATRGGAESAPATNAAAQTEASPTPATARPALIVEDEVKEVKPGQMGKTEFLSELRTVVCSTAEQALAGTMWSALGCPYIDRWLDHYSKQPSAYVERALRKYAPETASVRTAQEYFPLVAQRLRRGVEEWKSTGEVPDLPEELAGAGMPGATVGGLVGGLISGVGNVISGFVGKLLPGMGSAVSGLVSGAGRALSSVGGVLFKHREGDDSEPADPVAIRSQLGNGGALDGKVRGRMQSAFGTDFSSVRVHTDARAQALNESLNARAFTVGSDIAFGAGEYRPGTLVGDALIAHELAHVVQQGAASGSSGPMKMGDAEPSSLEEDADISAVGAMVSLWGGPFANLKAVGRSALPGLRAGLKLQKCSAKQTPTPSTLPKTQPTTPPAQPTTPSDSASILPQILEELGSAWCDPDQGKMVWQIKAEKIPSCMVDCVNAHELAHVQYGTAECTKVSAVFKMVSDAIIESDNAVAEARKNQTQPNLEAAQAAAKKLEVATVEFEKAVADYEEWFNRTCRENEGQAYQAGIDDCAGAQKECADAGQKESYKRMMKEWEEFKKNPPNCR